MPSLGIRAEFQLREELLWESSLWESSRSGKSSLWESSLWDMPSIGISFGTDRE